MRSRSWGRLALSMLLATSVTVVLGMAGLSLTPDPPDRLAVPAGNGDSARSADHASDDTASEVMLANYPGGHTLDKEIREETPRADGYHHVDTKRTIAALQEMNANTHFFLMWHSPSDWQDFTEEFLPAAQQAGIDVWAYIVPPSECSSTGWCSRPFETDYVAWAENIAQLSVEYDHLKGWVIDDFNNGSNSKTFTPEYMEQITAAADEINPDLELATVAYYGKGAVSEEFYETYAPFIDGVVFPYRDEPNHNTRRTSTLPAQLDNVISYTERYDLDTHVLFYTGRYGTFAAPKASYVNDLMATAREYARQGKIQGIVSYGTPHRDAQAVTSENEAMYGNGRLTLFAFAGAPDTDDHGSASQTVHFDPGAERYTLNFWIRNRFFGKETAGKRFAEVLVNGEVIWSTDIIKYNNDRDGRWRMSQGPIEIDPAILAGSRTAELTFRVRQEVPSSFHTETSFDAIQTSGFTVRNGDFESAAGWRTESTHGAFIPDVEIWTADRPARVFDAVAQGFAAI